MRQRGIYTRNSPRRWVKTRKEKDRSDYVKGFHEILESSRVAVGLGAVFSVLAITPPWNLQMTCGLLGWKANLIGFHTMCSMHHETLYIGTVLHGNLDFMQASDPLSSLQYFDHNSF